MSRIIALIVMTLIVAASPVLAAQASGREPSKQSGTIVSVDPSARTPTLAETEPWHGPRTALTDHSIALAPSARVELVMRTDHPAPGGWVGGYVDRPLGLDQRRPVDVIRQTSSRSP